jgi:alanyl-tRNA synthetase
VLETSCEIDVELMEPTTEKIERAVELANNVIWEDRAITIRNVTSEEAAELSLRKEPSREGELRLIEIDGFDVTPCGGTHAYRTGEVGVIVVRSWERAKGLTRIDFVAGTRALADYRKANKSAREVAALFSSGRDDIAQLTAHLLEEQKELNRQIRVLEEMAAEVEAQKLLSSAQVLTDGSSLITQIFKTRDAESLKKLAQALIANPRTIALLASRNKDTARLVFARSADAPSDMNALMREACTMLDGRGGGRPDLAQGGGKHVERLDETMTLIRSKLTA